MAADKRQREKLKRILERLERHHGPREWEHWGPGVDVLVGTILSQNTNDANSSAGYQRLVDRFPAWDQMADAPVREIERCIRVSGLSRVKAPRIRSILRQIRREHGEITLEHLKDWPPPRAMEYLLAFDGVGPKTALCVLIFSFHMPVFPVDTHIYRIAVRLGLMDESVPFARAHEVLGPMIAPGDRYATHVLLIAHGRTICRSRKPRCDRCYLLALCPEGRRRMRAGRA
ncbi:MAG: Ultraviolet N-glycosylase/AP lyase [Planctomycetes bacterium ADurb.Bin126]|nr:MAG: Ultraviolet N-glycosylase/AP lyase [Planctomycetes bacterium ADurb.Bin126]HOD84757.1 endonuclease III [Phycisphaerae bacterium]HQL73040.1 endonuclease III [Phycisphaerae bacterium]